MEKYFPASGNHFRFFSKKKQFFRILETYFSTNAPFRIVETDFLGSANHKLLFHLVEMYFFNESFIPAIGEGFSFYWKLSTLLESYFLPAINVTDMSGNHFLKIDLILASGNSFSSQWKPFSSIASHIFEEVLHPGQWKHIFQSRRKIIVFYLELFFLLVETII